MKDPRYSRLAGLLIRYSTALKKGDHVLLDMIDAPDEFAIELMRAARSVGAIPIVEIRHSRVTRELLCGTNQAHAALWQQIELTRLKRMQAYIAVRGAHNSSETSDVGRDMMNLYSKTFRSLQDYRVNKTRWCVLRWPTPSMAQAANMSTEVFENFFFDVCTMDYPRMARAMIPLQKRFARTNDVHIKSPGTDLRFSIQGMGGLVADGKSNIPDGEVFTAPIKNSAQGAIQFNTPTIYQGKRFENIRLELKDGKIANATGSDTKGLNDILDTDPGSRYIGEFALGFNPYILNPIGDILFDEKIAGSLHFTPGQAYEDADNGNRSTVHWDMVLIQRPDWGGGEIRFDGEIIRKDGLFVPNDLQALNPKNLK